VNGGGADDSMVDLSEDVTDVSQEESTAGGPRSITEQDSRLAEAFLPVSARQGTEVDAMKTEASRTSF
jgi:hypothetical protein